MHGSCLCGGVRWAVAGAVRPVLECHCHRCQKTSGNYVAATAAPVRSITLESDDTLRWYRPADDPGVAYGFCTSCGSSLFFDAGADDPTRVEPTWSIFAGSIDGPSELQTVGIWFASNAADHVRLDTDIESFDTQP